ncbi:MAG: Xaa-Pro peptidase family protein [Desulfotignum sp.]|nr:Xaa-Pro peptidase family protein [Desulfotignum sp.]MCF8112308.1 Xaa-Pro peptidase family protein [Desulfotignum sp.]MCF8125215.1 Xaa-Pro peptidase family protein [Desulfotignum sp.]
MENKNHLTLVPAGEIANRIRTLKTHMENTGMGAVFLTHKPDIYYFCGTAQDAWLYVPVDNDPLLFVKQYLPRACCETCIARVVPIASITLIPDLIKEIHTTIAGSMGLAFDVVPVRDFQFFQSLFSPAVFTDATALITACRMIKSDWEISRIKDAARVSKDTFAFICENLVPEESEIAFCGRIEAFARSIGHSGKLLVRHYRAEGFAHHLLSGSSGGLGGALDSPVSGAGTCSAYPFGAGHKLIQANEPVLMDLGTMVNGYHMDETRMLVMGKMPPLAEQAGLAAIEILYHVKDLMVPGTLVDQVFTAAMDRAQKLGLGSFFLGLPDLKSRFIGHGIGLELVEDPVLARGRNTKLLPGMVFAVEPKFIFKDRFAAGIESVIHITDKGPRFLSLTENRIFAV